MSFADPQSVDIGSGATDLNRTASGVGTGEFTSEDGTIKLTVAHTYKKRNRHLLRLDVKKIDTDTFNPTINSISRSSVYVVVDGPPNGVANSELVNQLKALVNLLYASTYAMCTTFVGGEQ